MTLSPMRYKTYTWPHNPRVYSIDYERKMAVHKTPFGLFHLQDLGRTRRVMKGEGEFVGPDAYAQFGQLATVFYEDGRQERFPLRNGMEFTTAYTTSASSRIDPHGENVTPFAYYSYDKNHENYILNRLTLPLSGGRVVRVEITEVTPGYDLLFYGAFVE